MLVDSLCVYGLVVVCQWYTRVLGICPLRNGLDGCEWWNAQHQVLTNLHICRMHYLEIILDCLINCNLTLHEFSSICHQMPDCHHISIYLEKYTIHYITIKCSIKEKCFIQPIYLYSTAIYLHGIMYFMSSHTIGRMVCYCIREKGYSSCIVL